MNGGYVRYWLVAILLMLLVPLSVSAQGQQKIVTLGADLTPEQRAALLERFAATEATDTILTVSTDEMRLAMQDIIPVPDGYTSVSSTALTCAAPGSGLRVSTENITTVTAAMYAGALVTAGVGDAELLVAAPADAEAEGMTALTGVFKGMEGGICGGGTLDANRLNLAYRQLALTASLAQATGSDLATVSDLMLRAQQNLVRAGNNADAAVPSAESAQRDTGVTLPQAQADELVQLLAAMGQANIEWGTYAGGWSIEQISPNEVRVAATTAATASTAAPTAGQQLPGTVISINPVRIEGAGLSDQLAFDDPAVVVVRNDQPAALSDLQPNDLVTVTLDSSNRVQRIEARSATGGASAPANGQTVQGEITKNANGTLSLTTATGSQDIVADQGTVEVRRNGQAAQLNDIQLGDTVTVQLDASGRPTRIDASSTQAAPSAPFGRFSLLCCLLPLLLLPFLFLFWRRRKNKVILVGPTQSTVIHEDDTRTVVDNNDLKR